jgi:hypothetical protein
VNDTKHTCVQRAEFWLLHEEVRIITVACHRPSLNIHAKKISCSLVAVACDLNANSLSSRSRNIRQTFRLYRNLPVPSHYSQFVFISLLILLFNTQPASLIKRGQISTDRRSCCYEKHFAMHSWVVYLTGNTLSLRYRDQPVNAVQGNSRCLLWEPYGTHKYTVWAEGRVLVC